MPDLPEATAPRTRFGANPVPCSLTLLRRGPDGAVPQLWFKPRMILAIDKRGGLFLFPLKEDAERDLEAVDVQQDAMEFCDELGQRYVPAFSRVPHSTRVGPFSLVDIGAFSLVTEGERDPRLPAALVARATHLEHSSVPGVTDLEKFPLRFGSQA